MAFPNRFAQHWYGLVRLGTDWSPHTHALRPGRALVEHRGPRYTSSGAPAKTLVFHWVWKQTALLSGSGWGVFLLHLICRSRRLQMNGRREEQGLKTPSRSLGFRRGGEPWDLDFNWIPSWIPPWSPLRRSSHASKQAASRDEAFNDFCCKASAHECHGPAFFSQ